MTTTEPAPALARGRINAETERKSEMNGPGFPMGSDTLADSAPEIRRVRRTTSVLLREILRPKPLPRSKACVQPRSLEPTPSGQNPENWSQEGKTLEEEDDEEEPCSRSLPNLSSPAPSSPRSPASPPPLPPPCAGTEKGQIPLYLEILPEEVGNLERSVSLVALKLEPLMTVQRCKSDSESLLRKALRPRIGRDQQKANRGAKKPVDTCNQRPRPERPPPPNFSKIRGGVKPPLPVDGDNGSSPGSCDTQDGDSESSLQTFEEDDGEESCSRSLPNLSSLAPLSPRSGQIPLYLEILPGELTASEGSNLQRSVSLVMQKPEPPIPVHRSKSHAEREKPAWFQISSDQPKANQGTKKPVDTCNRRPRPERPPPPNFSKIRGGVKPPLPVDGDSKISPGSCDTQDGDSESSLQTFEEDDEEEPCSRSLPNLSSPAPLSPRSPPLPPPCAGTEKGQIPLYLEILPEEVGHLERSASLVTLKPEPPIPVYRSKSHSELLFRKAPWLRIGRDQQKANRGAKKPLETSHRRPRPERPPPPNFSKSPGGQRPPLPIQLSTRRPSNGCDTQYEDSEPSPSALDTQNEDTGPSPGALDTQNEDTGPSPGALDTQDEDTEASPGVLGTSPGALDTQSEDTRTALGALDTQYEDTEASPGVLGTSPPALDTQCEDTGTPPGVLGTSPGDLDTQCEETDTSPAGLDSQYKVIETSPNDFGTHYEDTGTSPGASDSQDKESTTSPGFSDSQYADRRTAAGFSDSQYVDKRPAAGSSDSQYADKRPAAGSSDSQYADKRPAAGFSDSQYVDRRTAAGSSDSQYVDRRTAAGSSDSQYVDRRTAAGSSDSQYVDRRTAAGSSDSQYVDRRTAAGSSNTEERSGAPLPMCQRSRQTSGPRPLALAPPLPPPVGEGYSTIGESQVPLYEEILPEETGFTEAHRSKAVHHFFSKRPLPPIPQQIPQPKPQSEPLYEELGTCLCGNNDHSVERKSEDMEVLMAWWHTVEQWDNMPLAHELTEEEEMRVFTLTAYRIKMGLRLFSCLLSRNSESLQGHITELNTTADNLDKTRKRAKIATMTGGTTGAVGGVAVVAGLVLAPITLGASLVVSAVGVGVATAGGLAGASAALTSKVNVNLDRKRVEKIVQDYRDEVSDIERCLRFVSVGMEWLGQQDTSRLMVADEETAAVARLAEVASGNSRSIKTACQSLEVLQKFSLSMDDFFTNGESQKVKKGTETKFADKIRSLAHQLQEGLNSLMRIREILTLAASTTGVCEEVRYS